MLVLTDGRSANTHNIELSESRNSFYVDKMINRRAMSLNPDLALLQTTGCHCHQIGQCRMFSEDEAIVEIEIP